MRRIRQHVKLHMRTWEARGADLFLSIHHDSVRERWLPKAAEFSGFSLFVSRHNPDVEKSTRCASAIGAEMRATGLTPSRYHADPVRGENRPFADEENGVHFYDNLSVAKTARVPSVLFEAGVVVNAEDERRVTEPVMRGRIADAIARGVKKCMQ